MSEHGFIPEQGAHAGEPIHHEEHHGGLGTYIAVFIALCVLTTMSFFTYSDFFRSHFPPQVGWAFMMAVSCCKALLVILFFMHVKWEANWKYVLTIPAAFMSLFLILMLVPDVGLRERHAAQERQLNMPDSPATHKVTLEEPSAPAGHH
jgi:cytochrome c oxidase subunit 4